MQVTWYKPTWCHHRDRAVSRRPDILSCSAVATLQRLVKHLSPQKQGPNQGYTIAAPAATSVPHLQRQCEPRGDELVTPLMHGGASPVTGPPSTEGPVSCPPITEGPVSGPPITEGFASKTRRTRLLSTKQDDIIAFAPPIRLRLLHRQAINVCMPLRK